MSEAITEVDNEQEDAGPALTGKDLIREETSAEGRYIPYAGGSLGWFENSGVPKCEKGNGYKFYTAIDTVKVRQKLFERWGNDVNRRMESRFEMQHPTPVTIVWDGNTQDAETKDISAHGLRLQFLEEVNLKVGDKIQVQLFKKPDFKEMALEIASEIMWVARVGKRRTVWNIGIGFTDITETLENELKEFLVH